MRPPIDLGRLESVLDRSEVAGLVDEVLPTVGRPRQLSGRTLMLGLLLTMADDRPAHLSRVHAALCSLPPADRLRLGVEADRRGRSHLLTYRQVEHTTSVLRAGLPAVNGGPCEALAGIAAALVAATVPDGLAEANPDVAVDWTDVEAFARMVGDGETPKDGDAWYGHRRGDSPGQKDERFLGYYLQCATMVAPVGGPPAPELVRAMTTTSPKLDPPKAFLPVLENLSKAGPVGDVIDDCGYSYRQPEHWALPIRAMGLSLVQDLHPNDRGPKGTFGGAVVANGSLYCPATPPALLRIGPIPRNCDPETAKSHAALADELGRYRLQPITSTDADGYHRVSCPACMNNVRCPLRPTSLSLPFDRPEVLEPPEASEHQCCTAVTMTVPPAVAAKTAQRHEYPGRAWRESYARRSAAERTNATLKDPARTDVAKGWCRLMGLPAMMLFLTAAVVVRNLRILDSFDEKTAKAAEPTTTRKRRRTTVADLASVLAKTPL